jgi:hypothetical protein
VYRSVWPSKRKKTARPENFSRWRGKRLPSTSFVTYWNGEKRRLDTPSCVAIHRDGRFLHSHYKTHTHTKLAGLKKKKKKAPWIVIGSNRRSPTLMDPPISRCHNPLPGAAPAALRRQKKKKNK